MLRCFKIFLNKPDKKAKIQLSSMIKIKISTNKDHGLLQ